MIFICFSCVFAQQVIPREQVAIRVAHQTSDPAGTIRLVESISDPAVEADDIESETDDTRDDKDDTRDVKRHATALVTTEVFMRSTGSSFAPSPKGHLIVCAGLFILVVVLSISAVMVVDDQHGKRGQKLRYAEGEPGVLVPSLVVPRGKEFLFALKSAVAGGRQSERFSMVDPDNKPFCSVLLAESGPPNPSAFRGMYGILLETQAQETLAFLQTNDFLSMGKPVCPIHRKDGELFGYLIRDREPPRRYNIVAPHTGDALLSFHGDFNEQAVNVHNGHGQLIATTERHVFSFALDRYVQVRVAPSVDASLVMLGLLGIAKMEAD